MEEFVKQFGIDWKLLLAQAVNFFILLVLLKKFAYNPVIEILDRRRQKIDEGLIFSKKAKEELERVDDLKKEELSKAEKKGLEIISESKLKAEAVRAEVISMADAEKRQIISDGKKAVEEEHAKLKEDFYSEAANVVRCAVEKVLAKSYSEEDEAVIIDKALSEVSGRANNHV